MKEKPHPLQQDAVIQRFEFTYELLWKTFKKMARFHKVQAFSPRECFKFAFQAGLIEDEKLFMEIIDARNMTTHVYSEEEMKKIYEFIRQKVAEGFNQVQKKIEQNLKAESK